MKSSKRVRGEGPAVYKPRKASKGNDDENEEDEIVMWSQDSPKGTKGVKRSPSHGVIHSH